MRHDDLLDELRRLLNDDENFENAQAALIVSWGEPGRPVEYDEPALRELAAFVIDREHAAAERMRERCRLAMLEAHLTAMTDDAPENVVRATGNAIDSIDELEPEEPTQ